MLAMTNYSKHYASTIYQSLEGAEKKNHVLTKSPKHLPSPSEVKWMAPNIILLQQFLRFFLQDTGSSATNVFQNKARMTVSPETTPRSNSTGSCLQFEFDGELQGVGTYRVFKRECTMKSVCNDDICKRYRQGSITIRKCDFNCCESDLCNRNILNSSNGAKVPIASGFLFLVCPLMFFFLLKLT